MPPQYSWNVSIILVSFIAGSLHKDLCLGAKLERKQDFFDVESFDNKREYGLSEIGKRGFSSNLGFDYSTSSEYGVGAGGSVVNSDYSHSHGGGGRSGGSSDEAPSISSSPARDLIPPAPYSSSSSTSPPTSSFRSEYPKFGRFSSTSPTSSKEYSSSPYQQHQHHYEHHHQPIHRSQISRRSPPHHLHHHHHQSSSLTHYLDEISSSSIPGGGPRGKGRIPGSFGLVADNDGKLIGYRGSILPGYGGESQSIVPTSSNPDPANFIGSYYHPEYSGGKPKFSSLASSASSGSYTSTPVYYPGREEDHTYRMRDTTSQGYEDDEHGPSSEDNDFTVGSSGTYQPSPLPQPPSPPHHYHLRESDVGILGHEHGHNHIIESSRPYISYSRNHPPSPLSSPPGFSYGHTTSPLGKNHRPSYDYSGKRSYGPPPPPSSSATGYDVHHTNSVERGGSGESPSYGYGGLGYNDYGSS